MWWLLVFPAISLYSKLVNDTFNPLSLLPNNSVGKLPTGQAAMPSAPNPGPVLSRVVQVSTSILGTTNIIAHIGDIIEVSGFSFSPVTPDGFVVFALPGVIKDIDSHTFEATGLGDMHVAFPGGDVFVRIV